MLQAHLGVKFVSEGDYRSSRDQGPTDADRVEAIANRLRNAVALGDIRDIHDLARDLLAGGVAEVAVGRQINRLAMNFDFDGLGRLADSLRP